MRLTDLIDLEAQMVVDEGPDYDELSRRDRAIYASIDPAVRARSGRVGRAGLLAAWLDALRQQRNGIALGSAVVTGQRLLGYLLVVFGLGAGAGAAAGLLMYDGRTPVNVSTFLLAVVGVQIVLLVVLVLSAVAAYLVPDLPFVNDVRGLLRFLARALEPGLGRLGRSLSDEARTRWQVARSRLRTRASLYGGIERWLLLELSQVFAIAFNVGVLAMCLRLIYFSDLAFGWSTTADALDAATMYEIVKTLAAPWAGVFPDAVPTFELVSQSRFERLQGGFTAGGSGQWWRFLIAAVVTYGLLPRMGLWAVARGLRARALARVPLDTPDVRRIVQRLEGPRVETRSQQPPAPNAASERRDVAPMPAPRPSPEGSTMCLAVRWREVPVGDDALEASLLATFGYRLNGRATAGGLDQALDAEGQAQAAASDDNVVVVAEGWEAPDKGIRRYLQAMRNAVGPRRPIYVALVGDSDTHTFRGPDPDDVEIWRDRLTLLEDPYLGVEALEPAP